MSGERACFRPRASGLRFGAELAVEPLRGRVFFAFRHRTPARRVADLIRGETKAIPENKIPWNELLRTREMTK